MKFEQRPIILYVENIDFFPKYPEIGERVTVMDIEFSHQQASSIIEQLQKRLKEEEPHISGVRLRLSGRLVLP